MENKITEVARKEMQQYLCAGNRTCYTAIIETKLIKGIIFFLAEIEDKFGNIRLWLFMYNDRIKPITTISRNTEIIVEKFDENQIVGIALRGFGVGITGMFGAEEFCYDKSGKKIFERSIDEFIQDSKLFEWFI